MFRFSFITSKGEYSTYSLKAKNYTEAGQKARKWCENANCVFNTVTRIA